MAVRAPIAAFEMAGNLIGNARFIGLPSGVTDKLKYMEKLEKLELMDKILRELEDLKNSQTSTLKKVSQIEADNINLGAKLLDAKLPDLHEEIDSSVSIISDLLDEFQEHREKYYTDNKLAALEDPTAK